jgi:hypothetical protein
MMSGPAPNAKRAGWNLPDMFFGANKQSNKTAVKRTKQDMPSRQLI